MTTATVPFQLDQESAQIYQRSSQRKRDRLRLLVSLWLRESEEVTLSEIMDRMSDNAAERGLTPEILETLLQDKRTTRCF